MDSDNAMTYIDITYMDTCKNCVHTHTLTNFTSSHQAFPGRHSQPSFTVSRGNHSTKLPPVGPSHGSSFNSTNFSAISGPFRPMVPSQAWKMASSTRKISHQICDAIARSMKCCDLTCFFFISFLDCIRNALVSIVIAMTLKKTGATQL